MKKLLLGLAVLPFMAGVAFAGQSSPASTASTMMALSDSQMDGVNAGFAFGETDISNTSTVTVAVNQPDLGPCTTCYLQVSSAWAGGGSSVVPMQILSQFGPQ